MLMLVIPQVVSFLVTLSDLLKLFQGSPSKDDVALVVRSSSRFKIAILWSLLQANND